jgi:phosphate-selective porin OprO/OprP
VSISGSRTTGKPLFAAGLSFFVLLLGSAANAQDKPEPSQEPKKSEKVEKPWGFRWDERPSFFIGKGTRIDFRARLATHLRESEAFVGDVEAFDVARRRIGLDGRLGGVVDFQVEYEFGDDESWRDVYADYRQFEAIRVRGGKFKLPFSLDENTGSTNLDFVYRSRAATQLAPGRDRGVMVHGRLLKRLFGYEVGWFEHDGRNARSGNPRRVFGGDTVAGRFTLQPFRGLKSPLADLQFAGAITESDVPEGVSALRGRTALDAPFFPADYWVKGRRRRVGAEFRWRPGPFSLKSEYMRVTTERLGQSVEDSDLSPLFGEGWYVSGTWLVTGEKKSNGGDAPRRPLFRGGFGALELAARLEELRFGSTGTGDTPSPSPRADVVSRNGDRATTLGVNWFPIRGIKVQVNVIREVIADPGSGPLPSKPGFWSKVLRLQFTL